MNTKVAKFDDCADTDNNLCQHYPDTGELIKETNEVCWNCNRAKVKYASVKDRFQKEVDE